MLIFGLSMLYYVEFWHRELPACLLGLAEARDATLIRNKERAYFEAGETELMDAIDTFSRAIAILSGEMTIHPASFAHFVSGCRN